MAQAGLLSGDAPQALNYGDVGLTILYRFIDVLQAALIIVVGMFAIRYIRRYLQRIQVEHEAQRTALNLFEKITTGFIVVITITLSLKVIGLDLTLIISALMLGLSFGLKDIIKNYISGILILFKSPFSIGDSVKIRSYVGKVEKIEFQSTTLKTFDHKEITIYNKDVLTQSIVNFSKDPERRVEIRAHVGHGTNIERCIQIFDAVFEAHPKVLKKPKRTIIFRGFNSNGTELAVRFWVQRPCNILKIRTELAIQMNAAFDEANIFSPFSRSTEFSTDISMTDQRKERLRAFYSSPALAVIAIGTNGAVLATAEQSTSAGVATQSVAVAPQTDLIDEDEPEDI
ncbi:MAG: mechanosensitive ion channel domain-containing protein [Patescibacteria group bacterium]